VTGFSVSEGVAVGAYSFWIRGDGVGRAEVCGTGTWGAGFCGTGGAGVVGMTWERSVCLSGSVPFLCGTKK
jgi:hypothetical protein